MVIFQLEGQSFSQTTMWEEKYELFQEGQMTGFHQTWLGETENCEEMEEMRLENY